MSQSDDLSKLFNRYGGHPETYREIVREDAADEAQQRWPLLAALRVDRSAAVPPVQSLGIGTAAPPAATAPAAPSYPQEPMARAVPAAPAQTLQQSPWPGAPAVGSQAPLQQRFGATPPRVAAPGPATPAATASPSLPASLWSPSPSLPASPPAPSSPSPVPTSPALAAGPTPLARVFARLEGQATPPAQPEHTPSRRSFLDRLKRS